MYSPIHQNHGVYHSMPQGVLDFHYLRETGRSGMTSLAGLPAWLELGQVLGLAESIERHMKVRQGSQG